MFSEAPILIAEDNLYLSLDLSSAVEELDGRVVGPASTVAEALTLLAQHEVAAAIIDFQLGNRDASAARPPARRAPGSFRHPHRDRATADCRTTCIPMSRC